jgi:hypothetical protein
VLARAAHLKIFLSHSPERYPKPAAGVNGFPFEGPPSSIHQPR